VHTLEKARANHGCRQTSLTKEEIFLNSLRLHLLYSERKTDILHSQRFKVHEPLLHSRDSQNIQCTTDHIAKVIIARE
jgi:hypothetical protein